MLVRALGGAGDEWARGLAACPDGSVVAVSAIAPAGDGSFQEWVGILDPHDQPTLGIVRLERTGETRWAHEFATGGAHVDVAGVACSDRAVVLAVQATGGALDFGGSVIEGGAAVVLDARGRFVQQHAAERISGVAATPDAGVVVGDAGAGTVVLFGADGAARWTATRPASWGTPHVAIDPHANVLVAWDARWDGPSHIEKLGADGTIRWTNELRDPTDGIGAAEDGTVVASGYFIGDLTYGDAFVRWDGPGALGFVAGTAADGTPQTIRDRRGVGPVAVLPDGGVAMLEAERAWEATPVPRQRGCLQVLVRWDVAGKEQSRTQLATCAPVRADAMDGVWWSTIAAGPAGDVWVQGDALGTLDVGTGTIVPAGRDWLVLRFPP